MTFEDAQSQARPHSVALLYPTQVFAGAMLISLGPLLDSILRDLDLPLAKGGVLSFGFFFGRVLGVLLLNFGLARVSLKWAMVGSVWVMAVGLALSGLVARGLWSLVGALLVTGLAAVIPNAISGMWVGAHVRRGTERAMLMVFAYFALGVVVAPLIIGAVLDLGSTWRWVFIGEAAFSVLMAVALTMRPISDVSGRENLRLPQLREMAGAHPRLLAVMLVATFFYVGTETTLGVWLAKLQTDEFGASPAIAALSVTLFWAGIMLGRYLTVPLTRRMHPTLLLASFSASLVVFGLGIVVAPGLVLSQVFCFLAGLGASACFPLIAGYTSRFRGWHAGVAFSGMMLAGTTGSTLFPYLIGPVAEAFGLRVGIGVATLPSVFVVALAFVLYRVAGDSAQSRRA